VSAADGPPPATGQTATPSTPRRTARCVTLFSVPFMSRMTYDHLARLHSELDLVTYLTPKPGVSGASAGVVPLDFWSGLFLEHGVGEDDWMLEARTWDSPPESLVHEWHVRAALVARELDPTVHIPPRLRVESAGAPSLPLSRAANRRLSRRVRRLLHLD
jgi:hypothetical protein